MKPQKGMKGHASVYRMQEHAFRLISKECKHRHRFDKMSLPRHGFAYSNEEIVGILVEWVEGLQVDAKVGADPNGLGLVMIPQRQIAEILES